MKRHLRFPVPAFLLFLFFLGHLSPINAQSNSAYWKWAVSTMDTAGTSQEGRFDATDRNGNVFITGLFANTMTFDTAILTGINGGGLNMYIVKYSPSGQVLWARDASSTSQTRITPMGIATDAQGNVFVTGYFEQGTLSFNGVTLPGTPSAAGTMFIVKYDSSGHFLWAVDGLYGQSQGIGITTDNSGNAYITGYFEGDSFSTGSTTMYSAGGNYYPAFFAAKYDALGQLKWAKGAYGDINNEGNYIVADESANIYISGFFYSDSISFGTESIHSHDSIVSHQHQFLIKYDSAGNVIWAKEGICGDMSYDMHEHIYVIGGFIGDSLTLGTTTLYNIVSNYPTYFISKLDTSGAVLWAKNVGSGKYVYPYSIAATDAQGIIYVTSSWSGNIDSIRIDSLILHMPPHPSDPMIILTYDVNGNVLCGAALGSGGDDQNSVCTDASGNAFVTGDFESYGVREFVVGADTFYWSANASLVPGCEKVFTAKFNCNLKIETGEEELTPSSTLVVYPIPASTHVIAKYTAPKDSKENMLIIYDILGNQIGGYRLDRLEGELNINCMKYSSGVYFCTMVSDGKTVSIRKIVME